MSNRVEDLSALARRGALSTEDASELEALFAGEPEERFWHHAGAALDQEEAAGSATDEAAARVVARLLRGRSRKPPLRRRFAFALPAAAAVLVASLAAAAIVTVRHAREHAVPPALRAPPALPSTPALSAVQPTPPAEATPSAAPAARVGNDAPRAPGLETSPAELLSAAGRARRGGHAGQAVALLEQLQARFPNSPEASASDISLGKLSLQGGAAGAALQHFNRYLQRAGGGSLAPEALWGRAQALSALGSEAEARKTWAELAQRYPSSPYASLATAKLHGSSVSP